ncbi:MAG TPA: hypothetical protein VKP61_18155 [Candidatus Acidoferrum sp.]|nr:hypothetical protein [Candidatus Acidoferrum sp.]
MQRRIFLSEVIGCLVCMHAGITGYMIRPFSAELWNSLGLRKQPSSEILPDPAQTAAPAQKLNEIIARVFKREKEQLEIISSYSPIVETYIQIEKSHPVMGTVPKSDLYFLGIADFNGKSMKVRSMMERTHKGSIMWEFEPAGFLQMAFLDFGGFDDQHYRLTPPDSGSPRVFLGEVRCYVFNVVRAPKAKGARFKGRIWVEDQDFTIVRMSGIYAPEKHFSLKQFDDEFYLHFDSWRTNVKPGLWLPSDIYSQELSQPTATGGPRFKARTHFWGYGLAVQSQQEELGRLLIESEGKIKDESGQNDRSPLEQQRGWREFSEQNVFEVLQRVGLAAPPGNVEKVLNTIVNNIMVTNDFPPGVEIKCRVLMTSDLEMFSMQNTIALSRGLIDVVPNEETLAALLAFELADAMIPKPAQDQYGFSDILRLTPTQALKKLSFADSAEEARQNSEKALVLLKKSPYGNKLANVGLFLSQLQSQEHALKQLISPRLGNHVYFTSQLLQAAPPLDPASLQQIGALPMGSRIKINPWNDSVSLLKTKQVGPISPREKIPFEVTPIDLYLTRFVESTADEEHSILPAGEILARSVADRN